MGIKNNIVRDFDKFKSLNEDQGLLGFAAGELVKNLGGSIKEQITKQVLDYFGIAEEVEKGSVVYYIKQIFITVVGREMTFKEMDELLSGEQPIDDVEFWVEKISKATTHVLSKEITSNQITIAMGLDPETLIGRIITNSIDSIIRDEKEIERLIKGAWNILYNKEYIPSVESGELYQRAIKNLTPEQRKKLSGKNLYSSSAKQRDILTGGKG